MRLLLLTLAALVLAPAAAAHTDAQWQLAFSWPASGTVTSPFGRDGARWHPGIDIGTLRSLRISAAASGRVVRSGTPRGYSGYGNVVIVRLENGYETLYAHLARPRVRRGEWVAAGDTIGVAGCTGWCTGTHLHFEVRRGGRAIDPRPFLG